MKPKRGAVIARPPASASPAVLPQSAATLPDVLPSEPVLMTHGSGNTEGGPINVQASDVAAFEREGWIIKKEIAG